jgi:hypothetical protein
MSKKANSRQIRHLIEVMVQSKYYFEKEENPKLDFKFIEALQLFFLDSKGKGVQRVVNTFRTIDPVIFGDLPNTNFMSHEIKEKVFEFLKKNMKPKTYKRAKSFLTKNPSPSMFPAVEKKHPQKVRELNFDQLFFVDSERSEFEERV